MAYYFRASPETDRISWGDTTFWDGLSTVSTSIWINVDATRTSGEVYWRKDLSFTPVQWTDAGVTYRAGIWINGVLTLASYPAGVLDQWDHYYCTWANSDTKLRVYRNNVLGSTGSTVSGSISNSANAMVMGRTETTGAEVNGAVAEAASWNVVLTDEERRALSLGFCPLLIRPSALIFYASLDGQRSPALAIEGAPGFRRTLSGTLIGTAWRPHPPIIYPASCRVLTTAAASPPPPGAPDVYSGRGIGRGVMRGVMR